MVRMVSSVIVISSLSRVKLCVEWLEDIVCIVW